MAPLPPNPISGLLGGSNIPVSPPKTFSAPPGPQTVDSSPIGSLPLTLTPEGKLALPPNPITHSLLTGPKATGPLMEGRPGHQHPAGAMAQFQHQTEVAAAPAVADYNKRSGGTQGVVPGMRPEDLAQLRESASKNPEVAAAMGNLTNPESWVAGAVHGAKDVAAGVGKAVHGNLGGGATQAGLGALGLAGILPIGKIGKIGELAGEALLRRTPEEAAQHVLEVAGKAKAEGFGKKAADVLVSPGGAIEPRVIPVFHDPISNYSMPKLDDIYHAAPGDGEHLYHSASADDFSGIKSEGLKPGKVRPGEPTGVYFAEDGASIQALRPGRQRVGDVLLRVSKQDVPTQTTDVFEPGSGFNEHVSLQAVSPKVIEYLGHDNQWHPLGQGNVSETERAAQVRGALEGAPAARGAQKILQSAERGKRFAASAAEAQKHEGVAAYHAAVGQLRGKLPQINYKGFTELDAPTLNALLEDVKNHPTLMQGQKITAQRSLLRAVGEGKAPTEGEEKILRTVFGDTVTEQIKGSVGFFKTYKNLALDAANIPRAIMSSADLSAPLRQGLVAMTTHPVISLKAFPKMIKMFGSENLYQASRDAIENDPLFPLAMKAELPLTGIGAKDASTSLIGREEAYQSNLAERLNLREIKFLRGMGKLGTGPGDLIRASDRAYTGYLNQVRMDIFKSLAHDAAEQGRDINNTKLIKDIARFVGSATGRGPLGPLKNHAVSINALFFSPKLLASRLDILLSPVTYLHADPFVRRQALEATFKLIGTMSLVLYVAKLGGAQVGLDPTNADFAKIRIGNTRIDIAGGFQQPVRLAFELAEGKVTSSTTGKSMTLSGGIGKTSSGDVALRFLMGKAAPVPGFVLQASGVSQASFGPHQATWKLAVQKLLPLLAQDANDLRTTPGSFGGNPSLGKAVAGYGLGVFGVGEQTYAPKTPKPKGSGGSGGYGDTGGSYGGGTGGYGDTGGGYGGG